jgi:hypothetical protein
MRGLGLWGPPRATTTHLARRRAHDNEVRVRDLNHVFLYLLDEARLVGEGSAGAK